MPTHSGCGNTTAELGGTALAAGTGDTALLGILGRVASNRKSVV